MSTPAIVFDGGQIYNPIPLVSISSSPSENKIIHFGKNHTITLVGTILVGADGKDTIVDGGGAVSGTGASKIISIQKAITKLVHKSNQLTVGAMVYSGLTVQSIDFQEGIYVNTCAYTITINATKENADERGLHFDADTSAQSPSLLAYNLEDFNETFEITPDESFGYTSADGSAAFPRIQRLVRTVTATGSTIDTSNTSKRNSGLAAWEQANNYIYAFLGTGTNVYKGISSFLGSASVGTTNQFAADHSRVISIDKASGSATYTDTFVLLKGFTQAIETFEISSNDDASNPFVGATVNGTIKGISYWEQDNEWDTSDANASDSPISNAQAKWTTISNGGACGIASEMYKRANSAVGVTLNARPLSVSVSANEVTGEVTYNASYDNRPTNYFTNAISENVTVSDTSPGDQYAVIPVIGGSTGPILQFTFGRTEYRRSLSIDIQFDFKNIGYSGNSLVGSPSRTEPYKSTLRGLIESYEPSTNGASTWYLSPPSESWSPLDGRYSLTLEWVYK